MGGGDASASGSYLSSSLSVDGEGKGDRSAVPGSNIHIHGTPSSDSEVLTDANPNFKAHVGAEILQTPPQTHTLTQTETGAAAGMGAVAEADSNANSSLNSNTNATTRMIANNDVDLTSGLDYDYVLSLEDVNRGNNGGFTKGKLGRQRSVKEGRRFLDLGGRLVSLSLTSSLLFLAFSTFFLCKLWGMRDERGMRRSNCIGFSSKARARTIPRAVAIRNVRL